MTCNTFKFNNQLPILDILHSLSLYLGNPRPSGLTGSASASSSRVQSAVGSVVAGEDIDISFLNDNYMSLVDNEPVIQDEINYLKVV